MADLKTIFQLAANQAQIPMLYGTPEQCEDAHRRMRQADNAKPYPVLLVFNQDVAEISREYSIYNDFIVLLASRVGDEKISSKNDEVFANLKKYKDALIVGLCKTCGITGIYPSMFEHTQKEKLLLIATDKVCGLEVVFKFIQIKNC